MSKYMIICGAAGLIVAVGALAADLSLPAEQIRQGEAKQQQIKVQTKQVAAQLQSIIEEFRRNGLAGQDVAVLEAIRSVLDKLSEAEMKKVIDALQEARSAGDDAASKRAFTGAVAGQKSIVVQLRTLLLEYQRQQTLYDLSLRLAALALRQDGNMKNARDLAKSVGTRTGSSFGDDQKASLQIQHAEQQSIRDEVNPLLVKLDTIYKESEGSTKERLGKALELVKGGSLKAAMDAAIESLKGANLYNAAGSEMTVRDQLRDLSRMIAPPKDTLAALRAAAAEIEKAIEAQKGIIDETAKLNKNRPETSEVESKQGDLVDRTEQIRKDVEGIAPEAGNQLKNSEDQMQEARASLQERNPSNAGKSEQNALAKLEAAKKAIADQIAKAEPKDQSQDKLAAAKELQERTRELIKQEQGIKSETAAAKASKAQKAIAPKQEGVTAKTTETQRDAAPVNPDAAKSLADASQQMEKSSKSLEKGDQPTNAQEAQAAAISSLKQADEQLGQQIKDLEKAKEELANLEDSRAKIIKLIEEQQRVQLTTARTAAEAGKKQNDKAPAKKNFMVAEEAGQKAIVASDPKVLSGQQDQIAKDTEKVKGELQTAEKDAAQPLADAKGNMVDAKGKLDAMDLNNATPAQLEAIANLFKAKDVLDKRIDELKKQLGQEENDFGKLADAAAKIAELQKEIDQANDKLDPAQMQKSLEEQQRQIAKDLEQMNQAQAKPDANAQLKQAQQSAAKAAEQIAQNKLQDALKEIGEVQKGLKQAMKDSPQSEKGQPKEKAEPKEKGQQAQKGEKGQPGEKGEKGEAGEKQPKTPGEIAEKQDEIAKQIAEMAAGQQPGEQQAASDFEKAAEEANELAANDGGQLPGTAKSAVQQAGKALAKAAGQAASGQKGEAQGSASEAQAALAQAQAALSLAQAGLDGQMAQAKGEKGEGQGEGEGKGEGKGDGKGQGKGQGQEGQGEGQGQANEQNAKGGTGNREGTQTNVQSGGNRRNEKTSGQFTGLPARDRAAITQSQNDKYPEEYGGQIEQYLKNLADKEDK